MAGDWIKYDTTTHDKPEMEQIALALGIDDSDLAVGKLMRFWSWADQQSVDGGNLGVTRAFVDRIARCEGLAAALIDVGWLRERNGKLAVPNFDRHNGQSAKARAENTERKRSSRICHEKSVTEARPEKRREEKNKESTYTHTAEKSAKAKELLEEWNQRFPKSVIGANQLFDENALIQLLTEHDRTPEQITALFDFIQETGAIGYYARPQALLKRSNSGNGPFTFVRLELQMEAKKSTGRESTDDRVSRLRAEREERKRQRAAQGS